MQLKVTVNGVAYDVEVEVEEEPRPALGPVFVAGGTFPATPSRPAAGRAEEGEGVRAPLSGTVARIPVGEGDQVAAGDVVVVLEAMKMETEITAPAAGTVGAVLVEVGQAVTGGQLLVELAAG